MMKKLLSTAVASLLLLTACQTDNKKYTIEGSINGAAEQQEVNGKYAYLQYENDGEAATLDSVLVENNQFKFTGEADTGKLYYFSFEKIRGVRVILEPGTIKIDIDFANPNRSVSVTGTPLNNKLDEFNKEYSEKMNNFKAEMAKAQTDSVTPQEELQAKIRGLYEDMNKSMSEKAKAIYAENQDNILGASLFGQAFADNDSIFAAEYEKAQPIVKDQPNFKQMYEKINASKATAEGANYLDFDAIQVDDSVVKFSSFVDGENYLLVDFWAPWCGPCKRAMPFIKAVYEKYNKKGLRVLGVCTWEKDTEAFKKAEEEHGIVWESIYDKESAGADTYGVRGIPHLMLISPEGKILKRGITPDELEATIAEYIK